MVDDDENGYIISSPCESEGSGELKSDTIFIWSFDMSFVLTFLINELFVLRLRGSFTLHATHCGS